MPDASTQPAAADVLLVNQAEAARRLGISETSVKRAVRSGRLRRTKVGRSARYSTRELRRFVLLHEAMTAGLDEAAAARHADRAMARAAAR